MYVCILYDLECDHSYNELDFQGRGAVFLILGICSMLLFDNDQSNIPSEHRKLMNKYIVHIM